MQELLIFLKSLVAGSTTPADFDHGFLQSWRDIRDGRVVIENDHFLRVIDELFYEVDAFTTDEALLTEYTLGKFNIGEAQLREAVSKAIDELNQLPPNQG